MAGFLLAVTLALILPLATGVVAARRLGTRRPVLLGAATFIAFQMLTRIPLLQLFLPHFIEYTLFQFTQPLLYLLFLSLTAGLFEEIGRYLVMRRWLKDAPVSHAIAFGIGHGGIEAILLVGINLLAIALTGAVPIAGNDLMFLSAGAERVIAMIFHICLSVMVWRSLKQGKGWLILAILLHTLFNLLAGILAMNQVPVLVIELTLGLVTLLLLTFTVWSRRRDRVREVHHESTHYQ